MDGGDLDVEDQQRDGDREDAVTERLCPRPLQASALAQAEAEHRLQVVLGELLERDHGRRPLDPL